MNNRYFTEDTAAAGGVPEAGAEGLRRGQFTFYASFFRAIDNLPKSRQLETYRAVIDFALNGAANINSIPNANNIIGFVLKAASPYGIHFSMRAEPNIPHIFGSQPTDQI